MSDSETTKKVEEKKDGKDKTVKGASKSMIINIVLVVVIVTLTGCIVFLISHKGKKSTAEVESKREVVVNEKNIKQAVEQLDNDGNVVPGNYEVTMNATWKFADGKAASSNAYVKNAENNTNAVYFDVILSDTNETIYKSPILPLGSYIDGFKLDKELSKGEYEAIVVYHLIDDDQKTISTVNMKIKIIIEA